MDMDYGGYNNLKIVKIYINLSIFTIIYKKEKYLLINLL